MNNPKIWSASVATAFRFKRIQTPTLPEIQWVFEGQTLTALEGDTVATALLANGIDYTRTTPVSNQRRAPFCMMGTCYECLVDIDDVPNRQACQVLVRSGMIVKRMLGARDAADV